MIVTSEYIFLNPKLNEINDNIKNTQLENIRKHGDNYCRKIEVRCNIENFDKTKNKTKNVTIKHYHIPNGKNKTINASQGRYEINKRNKLIILLEGNIYKNVLNTCMKCKNLPKIWRKFFSNIANNRDYVYKFCKRPYIRLHQHCREWFFYNSMKNNTEMDYDNDYDNNFNNHIFLAEAHFDYNDILLEEAHFDDSDGDID